MFWDVLRGYTRAITTLLLTHSHKKKKEGTRGPKKTQVIDTAALADENNRQNKHTTNEPTRKRHRALPVAKIKMEKKHAVHVQQKWRGRVHAGKKKKKKKGAYK